MWGVFPLYFRALNHVPPLIILCHRILWSSLFLAAIITVRKEWRALGPVLKNGKHMLFLAAGAVLIALNWLIFIYAVSTNQVLQSSLGYFINPLLSIALGMLFLGERLRRLQWLAVAVASLAVINLALRSAALPWIAVSLAFSFGFYGLVRKKVNINSLHGLLLETVILLPLAVALLVWLPSPIVSGATLGMLSLSGFITATPLLFFGAALRRLKLSTIGFLQYVGPSLQFLVAVLMLGEKLDPAKLTSFILCWAAIGIYVVDSLIARQPQDLADEPE
jgi:chloramphenicol-sensitive protein RarD